VTKGYDYEEVEDFTIGIRVYFNDQQIDAIPLTIIDTSIHHKY